MAKLVDLLREAGAASEDIRQRVDALRAAIDGRPPHPTLGSPAFYEREERYLQDNVHPIATQILDARTRLQGAIQRLHDYSEKTSKPGGKRSQARSAAHARQDEANAFDQQLRGLLYPVEGRQGDVIRALKAALDD